jgi:hypothetical protein
MKNLVIILIAVLSLSGCDRVNPKNYPFYCKIDGKKFVPENDSSVPGTIGSDPYSYTFSEERGSLFITVRNSPQVVTLRILFPNKKIEEGKFTLSDEIQGVSYAVFTANNGVSNTKSYSQSGWIRVTHADENGHFNGEFEFTTYNEYLGKTVKITEGKFRNK